MDEAAIKAKLDELKPQLLAMAVQYDTTDDEAERGAIANEAQELVARVCIRHMIEETAVKPLLAVFGVQQFARHLGGGLVYAEGGTVSANLQLAMRENPEFVVPKP
jgi:hypothetical protein